MLEKAQTAAASNPERERLSSPDDATLDLTVTDLQNLVAAAEIAAVFLDRDLRIKRFTAGTKETFGLTPDDVGRPLAEIRDRLADEQLIADAEQVLRELTPLERELRLSNERWVLARLVPYRTENNEVAGVVATSFDISERKRALVKLEAFSDQMKAQLDKFNTVMNSVPDFVYHFDLDGRFTFVNQSLLDLWGKTLDDAIGKNFHDLEYPPELAARLQRQIQEVINTNRSLTDQTLFTSAAGTHLYEYLFFPILAAEGSVTAIGGITRDITERKRSDQALSESEERFRLLVEGARDYAMFLIDPENQITFWSSGAEKVFGWSASEAVGRSADLIFTPEDKAKGEVEKEFNTALQKGRALDRRFHLRKDGSRFWADGVMTRLNDDRGEVRGLAKIARDASDQRDAEDALRHARDELEQRVVERTSELISANNELERTIAERQQLEKELLQISEREKRRIGEDLHDIICQELTATALFLKSSANKLASKSPAAAKTLEESAQTVNRNVGLARDLARGLQPADLKGSGLKEALRVLAEQATIDGGVKCHFKAARGVRVTDDTIALHLYRVAQEALNNALKHAEAKNILISLDRNPEHVCVTVEDDGKGFSLRRRSKGLGLHIMRYRANALGGELKIEKRKRGGMSVTCVFPTKR